MKNIKIKKILFGIVIIIAVMIALWLSKYIGRVRYLENTFDVEFGDMVEEAEGSIKPGIFIWPESMNLKLKIKKGNEAEFVRVIDDFSGKTKRKSVKNILEFNKNENFIKYANEIESSTVEEIYLTWVPRSFYDRPILIIVTNQNKQMVVYFLDEYG